MGGVWPCSLTTLQLLLLLSCQQLVRASDSVIDEDNHLPSDEELLSTLHAPRQPEVGQPEVISSLGLPSDEESFNSLMVLAGEGLGRGRGPHLLHPGYFYSGQGGASSPQSGTGQGSGTFHFVSSTFPEVDARGFHESVFDSIGDYFPTWPKAAKRMSSADIYQQRMRMTPFDALLANGSPNSRSFRKRAYSTVNYWPEAALTRKKRHVEETPGSTSNGTDREPQDSSHKSRPSSSNNLHHVMSTDDSKSDLAAGSRTKRSGIESRLRRARGSMGFHADTFSDGFGDFQTMKRSRQVSRQNVLNKLLAPLIAEYDERLTKRRPEMDSMGFHGDTFGGGFGDFETMKKRRPEMDSMGFHGDTFGGGFGDFETMKKKRKRRPEMDSSGFHGDMFGGSFGDFETMKKRRPEMDSMGFHGDTFGGGFGDFETMKKRRPEMDSMGFHGDTFGGGFGDFETMKKRRPEMDSMGFHGDTFGGGFGDFETMKKRRPEMDSMGFHGDTFGGGFGDFETMKKRRPEMDSMGFHGDLFGGDLGEFETMKKRALPVKRKETVDYVSAPPDNHLQHQKSVLSQISSYFS